MVTGGRAKNQVPDQCEFMVDVRSTPNLDHAALTARVAAERASGQGTGETTSILKQAGWFLRRDSAEFIAVAHEVREALADGHHG